jgi:hypothetical protein
MFPVVYLKNDYQISSHGIRGAAFKQAVFTIVSPINENSLGDRLLRSLRLDHENRIWVSNETRSVSPSQSLAGSASILTCNL